MNYVTYMGGILLCYATVSAQNIQRVPANLAVPLTHKQPAVSSLPAKNLHPSVAKPAAVIWSETFGSGIPAGWSNVGVSDPDALWVYRGPATTPNTTVGGQGDCSGGVPINSPTKSNGFIIFDSNYLDNNVYCGGGNAGTAPSPQNSYLRTGTIDLSAYPSVVLKFYYSGRNYQGVPTVSISGDGGSTWTQVWTWSLNTNQASANPELVTVNIGCVAGGSANTQLEFRWEGTYYEFMIDDISIEDAPGNDVQFVQKFYYGYEDSTATKYYRKIPLCHASQDSLLFGGSFTNLGSNAASDLVLAATVTGPGTFSDTSNSIASFNTCSIDSLNVVEKWAPAATGTYTVTWTVLSDSNDATPSDNSFSDDIIVTDTIYSRDVYDFSVYYKLKTNVYSQIGNFYAILDADTATSITASFYNISTIAGDIVQFHLYDNTLTTPVGSSNFYSLSANDIGPNNFLTLPIYTSGNGPVAVAYGGYVAAVEVWSDSVDVLGESGAPPLTSFLYYQPSNTWYYMNDIPIVRLNLKGCDPIICAIAATASSTPDTCASGTGIAGVTVTGAIGSVSYQWSGGGGTNAAATGLSAGTYTVTVTDAGSCTATVSITLTSVNTNVSINSLTTTSDTCSASLGTAAVNASGGIAPLTYVWSPSGFGATATGLTGGIYTVVVSDSYGCSATTTGTVSDISTNLSIDAITATDESSCGAGDGSVSVTTLGGLGTIGYLWSTGDTTATVNNLTAGSYQVTVTDYYGCTDAGVTSVNSAGAHTMAITSTTDVSCNGGNDGTATVAISGGTPPFTYLWNTSQSGITTSATVTGTGLAAGVFSVTVTGGDSCVAVSSGTLTEPTAITINDSIYHTACNNIPDGSINIFVQGGTPSYTFSWSNGSTLQNISSLPQGTYTVTVTDNNGCTKTNSASITAPSAITGASAVTPVACNGGSTGSINFTATGGTPPYLYSWSDGSTSEDPSGLAAATYSVTITDSNGCTASAQATVTEPNPLIIVTDSVTINKIYISVSGGTSGYTYEWNNGSTVQDPTITTSGTFTVTVTDSKSCTATLSVVGGNDIPAITSFEISPNPGNGEFTLKMVNPKKAVYSIEIRNILGQIIVGDQVTFTGKYTRKFDLSRKFTGVYFLKISNGKEQRTDKIVIY